MTKTEMRERINKINAELDKIDKLICKENRIQMNRRREVLKEELKTLILKLSPPKF